MLSIAAAVITIGLKLGAYYLTGSVGLFSDAAESVVNLVAAVAALWALTLAVRPPDEEHAFGHNKAEYFSSGLESALIIIAAVWIGVTAWGRLMDPQPLQNVGLGLSVTLVADGAQRRRRARAPAGRPEAAFDHAPGRRAAPAHRRMDLRSASCSAS